LTTTSGTGFTKIDFDEEVEQPLKEYVKVYVVLAVGETVIDADVAFVDHKYVPPTGETEGTIVKFCPEQIESVAKGTIEIGLTTTVALDDTTGLAIVVQPFIV
jgi:hypothetical protein